LVAAESVSWRGLVYVSYNLYLSYRGLCVVGNVDILVLNKRRSKED